MQLRKRHGNGAWNLITAQYTKMENYVIVCRKLVVIFHLPASQPARPLAALGTLQGGRVWQLIYIPKF